MAFRLLSHGRRRPPRAREASAGRVKGARALHPLCKSSTALDALNAARPLVVVNDGDPDRVQRFLAKSGYESIQVLAPNEIRGLDRDVDVVLSLGRPATCDDYLHVAGRTARAGLEGICCTIAAHRDAKAVAAFASPLDIVFEEVADAGELGKYRM